MASNPPVTPSRPAYHPMFRGFDTPRDTTPLENPGVERSVPRYNLHNTRGVQAIIEVTGNYNPQMHPNKGGGDEAITRLRLNYPDGSRVEFTRQHTDGPIQLHATRRDGVDVSQNPSSIRTILNHTQQILQDNTFRTHTRPQFPSGDGAHATDAFLNQLQRQYPEHFQAPSAPKQRASIASPVSAPA